MTKKIVEFIRNEKAFSLTEVLIAVVILGLAGVIIINGITTDTKVRGKTNSTVNKNIDLNSASEVILSSNLSIFKCDVNAKGNYEAKIRENSQFNKVIVSKVEGLELNSTGDTPQWVNCDDNNFMPAIEKIYLTTSDSANAKNYERQILKTDTRSDSGVVNPFLISANKANSIIAAQGRSKCGAVDDTIVLSNSLQSQQITYAAVSRATNIAIASVTSPNSKGESILTITGGATSGTTKIDIQAISTKSTVLSEPIHIDVQVLSKIEFNSPDLMKSVSNHPRALSVDLSGLTDVPTGYGKNVDLINSSSYFSIMNGIFGWKTPGVVAPANIYDNLIKISVPGLPNAINCTNLNWKIPIQVVPAMSFTLDTSSRYCLLSIDGSNCSIPVSIYNGSDSGVAAVESDTRISQIPINYYLSITGTACSTPYADFPNPNPLTQISIRRFKVAIRGNITSFDLATTANFSYRIGTSSPLSLNNASVISVEHTGSQGSAKTYVTLETPSATQTIDVTSATPISITIVMLNTKFPKLSDFNFSSSSKYDVTSSTPLPLYCTAPTI